MLNFDERASTVYKLRVRVFSQPDASTRDRRMLYFNSVWDLQPLMTRVVITKRMEAFPTSDLSEAHL